MIFGILVIIIGLAFLGWTLFRQETLSLKWNSYLTLSLAIMTVGVIFLDIFRGYKTIMVVITMLMGFFIVMKLRINIMYQVMINVLFVFIAVALIGWINAI